MSTLSPQTRDKLKRRQHRDAGDRAVQARAAQPDGPGRRPLSPPKAAAWWARRYTLRYIPAREDLNPMTVFRNPRIRSARRWRSARRARCW